MSTDTFAPWRVLLVEDNALDRAESKAALITGSSRRYIFSEAASADETVALCIATPPFDCILLDFGLPDGDGLDVLARLPRDGDGLLLVPVLILTIGVAPDKHRALLRAGAQDYVGKAWLGPESLTRAVENTVERHAMQRELNLHCSRQRLMAEGANMQSEGRRESFTAHFERVGALIDADLQCHCFHDRRAGAGDLPGQMVKGMAAGAAADFSQAYRDEAAGLARDGSAVAGSAGSAESAKASAAPPAVIAALMKSLGAGAVIQHRVVAGGKLIATMSFGSRSRSEFSRADIDFIQAVGRQLSESSERSVLYAQFRESEAFNSGLLDSSIDCVFVLSADGRIQHLNEGGMRLLEVDDLDRVLQRKLSYLWPEAVGPVIDAAIAAAANGQPGTFEAACPTFAGTMKWWEVSVSPIRDTASDNVRRVLVVSRDATARRDVARALQESRAELLARETELRTLTDNAPDVWTRFDRDLRHVFVNAAVTRTTGKLPSEIIGKTNRDLGMAPDHCALWDTALRSVFESGKPTEIEFKFDSPGGTRHYLARLVAEPSHDNTVRNVLSVAHDVTDRKHVEIQREELLKAERAARLESDRLALIKDEFLGTLSHELRTPLAAIVGWANILKRPAVDVDTVRKGVEVIARNGKLQARLIDDLLDMNRIVSGKLKMELALLDIAVVALAVVDTLRPSAEAKGLNLQMNLSKSTAARVRGDATRLQQVLSNLIGNAIKFTPAAGVITVRTDVLPGGAVTLSVEDTGKGIDARFLPFLFDRFSQADGSAAREHGGLGLGLSIVRQLTELHGGTVSGHSEGTGRGALFVVTLPGVATEATDPDTSMVSALPAVGAASAAGPVRAPELEAKASEFSMLASQSERALEGITVVLVDDQPDVLELVCRLMVDCGAQVRMASSGADALEMLRDAPPDILISDIGMPGMDGYELLAQVRGVLGLSAAVLPALALTAFTRPHDRSKSIEAGYQVHLEKPIRLSLLIQAVLELTAALPAPGD